MADIYPPQEPLPPEKPFPGEPFPQTPVNIYDASPVAPAAKKTNWWLIIIIILLLLCCCCVLLMVFMYQVGGDWIIDNFELQQYLR